MSGQNWIRQTSKLLQHAYIPTTIEVVQLLHHLRKLRYVSMYFQGGAIIAPPCCPIPMYKPVEMSLAYSR